MQERIAILMKDPKAELPRIGMLRSEEYLKINPLGRIPALEDDGKYLSESTTICEYLEERYPNPPLLPADAYGRARVRLLCRITDIYLANQLPVLARNIDPLTRSEKEVDFLQDYLKTCLWEFDQLLGDGPWAYGSALSLADCVMIPTFVNFQMFLSFTSENLGITAFDAAKPFPANPKVARWWSHIQSHPTTGPFAREYDTILTAGFSAIMPNRSPSEWGIFLRARGARH